MKSIEYTWKQHFQFGYAIPGHPQVEKNVRWLARRERSEDVFVAKYGRCEQEIATWRQANVEAACRILLECKQHSLRPLILYSGGLDSEIVLFSFLEARKSLGAAGLLDPNFQIDVVTLRLTEGSNRDLNQHDILHVKKFRARLDEFQFSDEGLRFLERELDIAAYWASQEFLSLALSAQVVSPIIVSQLWLCEKMLGERTDYLPVIGQGEIHLVKSTPPAYEAGISPYLPSTWSIVETENLCGLYRYFASRNLPAIPGFFQFLPEQFEAQLRTNRVLHELIANQRVGKLGTRSSKPEILAFDYPELETRPKYHGFEQIEEEHNRMRMQLGSLMPDCEGHWYQEVFQLYRTLRPLTRAPIEKDDWWAGFGKPGEPLQNRRVDKHDVFATEWKKPNAIVETWFSAEKLGVTQAEDLIHEAARSWLEAHSDAVLFDDGSLIARWFYSLLPGRQTIDASAIPRMSAADVCRDLFLTDLAGDPDLYLHFKVCQAHMKNSDASPLILPRFSPRLHRESIFASDDSWIWIESEKDARLLASLEPNSRMRLVTPWTNESLVNATVSLLSTLRASGITWSNWLEKAVAKQEAELVQTARLALSRYEATRHRTEGLLALVPHPGLPYMNATTVLEPNFLALGQSDSDQSDSAEFGDGIFPIRSILSSSSSEKAKFQCVGLVELPIEDWLQRATFGTPEFRLGGNLLYRQTLRGKNLLDSNSRVTLGLERNGEIVSSALLQILDTKGRKTRGKLRIRCVTTFPGFERQGCARELIEKIVFAAEATLARDFSSIEVWAAPEIVSGFLHAGFVPASDLRERYELIHNIANDRLVESDRRLRPLRRLLSPTNEDRNRK